MVWVFWIALIVNIILQLVTNYLMNCYKNLYHLESQARKLLESQKEQLDGQSNDWKDKFVKSYSKLERLKEILEESDDN